MAQVAAILAKRFGEAAILYDKYHEAELEWVRANPKGRHAKGKARLKRYDELASRFNITASPIARRIG